MRKFSKIFALLLVLSFTLNSCYTLEHTVGDGAQGGQTEDARQWYVLWGLVPMNEVDSKQMAGGATDYTITTQHTFVDYVIGFFTGIVSIVPKTVKVTK